MSRERILGAVRNSLGRTEGAPVPPPPPVPLLGRVDLAAGARAKLFEERLTAVGGQLHLGMHDGGLAAVTALLQTLAPRSIARSDSPFVAALREHASLRDLPWLGADADKAALFAADVGITTAQWGIATTGTLVLDGSRERHRLASLLPAVHIALLPAAYLLSELGEVLKSLPRPVPPAVTFITGPSRTADIELQLVVGVHGPKQLHVVLV